MMMMMMMMMMLIISSLLLIGWHICCNPNSRDYKGTKEEYTNNK
jgi:hypothetical protein